MKLHFSCRFLSAAACLTGALLGLSPGTQADTFTLSAVNSGFYNALGRNAKYDGTIVTDATYNYSVGAIDDGPLGGTDVLRKNFFTFDLSAVTDPILSATLILYNPGETPDGVDGYASEDASEMYVLGGTLSPSSTDMAMFATELTMAWDPFMSESSEVAKMLFGRLADTLAVLPDFGIKEVSIDDNGAPVPISLSATGVTYLNMFSGGPVVLGGVLATLDATTGPDEVMFGYTKPLLSPELGPTPTPMLMITTAPVPAPPALLTTLIGIVPGVVWLRRRKRY